MNAALAIDSLIATRAGLSEEERAAQALRDVHDLPDPLDSIAARYGMTRGQLSRMMRVGGLDVRGKALVRATALAERARALARMMPLIRAKAYADTARRGIIGPPQENEAERLTTLALVDFVALVTRDEAFCAEAETITRFAARLAEMNR